MLTEHEILEQSLKPDKEKQLTRYHCKSLGFPMPDAGYAGLNPWSSTPPPQQIKLVQSYNGLTLCQQDLTPGQVSSVLPQSAESWNNLCAMCSS